MEITTAERTQQEITKLQTFERQTYVSSRRFSSAHVMANLSH